MKALVIAQHDNHQLREINANIIFAASKLTDDVELLIAGSQCEPLVADAKKYSYVTKILSVENACYENAASENLALLIVELASQYDYILAAANTFGKDLLPRVAGLLQIDMVSDVVEIISREQYRRPLYAGNAIATVNNDEKIKILSIRATAFNTQSEQTNRTPTSEILTDSKYFIENKLSKVIKQTLTTSSRPDLALAKIVIAGGRGLKSAENFKRLEELADLLGAAVGASRAAVDAGFAPNDYQIGQTGKIIAPELYIAVGISGAIQHIAGMKESKTIVAINNDPDAPIFAVADYGLVGDLFSILTELTEAIKVLKG